LAYADGDKPKKSPKLDKTLAKLLEYEQSSNIAALLDAALLEKIGSEVEREYKIDKASRSEWEESANRAMDIALQVRKPKNYPFENAANIKYPLVTVAALQFGARAYPAIVDGNRIVKARLSVLMLAYRSRTTTAILALIRCLVSRCGNSPAPSEKRPTGFPST
jgi:chaperonin GroES